MQLSTNNYKLLYHLFIDIMSLPVERLKRPRFQIITFIEILELILIRRLYAVVDR
jgi:hypothetical protein